MPESLVQALKRIPKAQALFNGRTVDEVAAMLANSREPVTNPQKFYADGGPEALKEIRSDPEVARELEGRSKEQVVDLLVGKTLAPAKQYAERTPPQSEPSGERTYSECELREHNERAALREVAEQEALYAEWCARNGLAYEAPPVETQRQYQEALEQDDIDRELERGREARAELARREDERIYEATRRWFDL